MAVRPRVLLLGDVSLERVQAALKTLNVDVDFLRGEIGRYDLEGPYDLVVATVKATFALPAGLEVSNMPGKPTWIAVHSQDFLPLRERLRGLGVHYLMQASVNPAALKLLLVHTLYKGPERRRSPRLPVGSRVLCMGGSAPFEATLVDMTRNGCRLELDARFEPPREIHVELPPQLAGGEGLTVRGSLHRAALTADRSKRLVTLLFESLDPAAARQLDAVLAGQTIGTVVTRLGEAGESIAPEVDSAQEAIREELARVAPEARIGLFLPGGIQMTLGRDLSVDGVGIDPIAGLERGRSVDVAVYGPAHDVPVLAEATVTGDVKSRFRLRFEMLAPRERERLQEIILTSSQIEALAT